MAAAVYFAPMQGFTESAYRNAHNSIAGGIDSYYTPFLRYEHGEIRRKDLREIDQMVNDAPIVPQVIAAGEEEFRILCSAVIEAGHKEIDLNMGCPFPMQTRKGKGSGLLSNPDALSHIISLMEEFHKQSGVSFSVKMRLGNHDPQEYRSIMELINAAPLGHVTIHPRIATQQYKGSLYMDELDSFMSECTHPVIFNGDICTTEDIDRITGMYPGLKGIMIGRGLLRRPTLASEYKSGVTFDDDKVRETILEIHSRVLSQYQSTLEGGDGQILQKIQPFWEYCSDYFDKKFIKQVTKTRSLGAYLKMFNL